MRCSTQHISNLHIINISSSLFVVLQGRAWADEPYSADSAHEFAPCSNMGRCDRSSGVCKCREGYSGPACDIRDCHRDKNCK
jgi:hypothetical protein